MRLMMIDYDVGSGTEKLFLKLLREFSGNVERLLVVAPRHRIAFLQKIVPPSSVLVYESLEWEESGWQWLVARWCGRLNRLSRLAGGSKTLKYLQRLAETLAYHSQQTRLRFLIRSYRITHCLCHWILHQRPLNLNIPLGVLIQDLNWHEFPENFIAIGKDRAQLDREILAWCDKADALFPISDYTLNKLAALFPQHSSKMRSVPHGAEIATDKTRTGPSRNPLPGLSPLLYYPGSVYAHKNHLLLLKAVAELLHEGLDFRLVMTGWLTDQIGSTTPVTPEHVENCRRFFFENKTVLAKHVHLLGIVEPEKVEQLYAGASLVVLPSAYEGFGMPLVEALEQGIPAVCSDIPPFLEQLDRYDCTAHVSLFRSNDLQHLTGQLREAIRGVKAGTVSRYQPDAMARWTWKHAASAYLETLNALPST